jgi:tryptophan-rich sensory protein
MIIIVIILGLSAYEVYTLKKKRPKKDIITLLVLMIITITFSIYYKQDKFSTSLSLLILKMLGMEY